MSLTSGGMLRIFLHFVTKHSEGKINFRHLLIPVNSWKGKKGFNNGNFSRNLSSLAPHEVFAKNGGGNPNL